MNPTETRQPNGIDIHYASKNNLDMLRQEFDEDPYKKHGIELKDGDCILDVGANIGFFAMYLNQHLSDASVYSFEPIPETFSLLERNVKRHNKLEMQTFNFGLSDESGTATFTHYPKANICSTMFPQESAEYLRNSRGYVLGEIRKRGTVLKFLVDRTPDFVWYPLTELIRRYYRVERKIECKLRTLSEVIDDHEIQNVDYLKVDTEGAEMNVLQGIRNEHWPRVRQIVIEVHHGKQGLDAVEQLLRAKGFDMTIEQPCQIRGHLYMVYAKRQDNDRHLQETVAVSSAV